MNKSVETLLEHAFKCIFYDVSLNVSTVNGFLVIQMTCKYAAHILRFSREPYNDL